MPIQIAAPDGNIAQFPDGMSDAAIEAVMRREYPPPKAKPNAAVDAAKSVPGGLGRGIAGLTGDAAKFGTDTFSKLAEATIPGSGQYVKAGIELSTPKMPTSKNVDAAFYQPETTAGKYAQTISSFVPAAAAPGSIPMRAARVVIPSTVSETAGQATQGTPLEPYARGAGALLGVGATAAIPSAARSIAGIANRVSESVLDTPLRDPTAAARTALRRSIAAGGGAEPVINNINNWAASGASNPALIDVVPNNVRRLVRAAAGGEGDAQNTAQSYADRIAGNLQERASARARELTPNERRPANIVREDLNTTRDNLAQEQYPGPYAEPASVTPEMVSALQGPEGRGAIGQAFVAARANRDAKQMAELQDLIDVARQQGGGRDPITGQVRSIETALAGLSSGSLDRVRIAMRETGNTLAANGKRSVAQGYRGRVSDIDTALDQTPGLTDARATYRNYSDQISGLDLGATALNTPSSEYAWQLADLASRAPRVARNAAGVGYRDAIVSGIERPAEGSTGFLNTLATSDRNTKNLTSTFGAPAAERFQAGVGNEASRLKNARYINPTTGSQTEGRLSDRTLVDLASGNAHGIVRSIIDQLRTGAATLTARERNELVRLGTTEADLRALVRNLPQRDSGQIATAVISGQIGHSEGRSP